VPEAASLNAAIEAVGALKTLLARGTPTTRRSTPT
jgi:hypothetical protein